MTVLFVLCQFCGVKLTVFLIESLSGAEANRWEFRWGPTKGERNYLYG